MDYIIISLLIILIGLCTALLFKKNGSKSESDALLKAITDSQKQLLEDFSKTQGEIQKLSNENQLKLINQMSESQREQFNLTGKNQEDFKRSVVDIVTERISALKTTVEQKLSDTEKLFRQFSDESKQAQALLRESNAKELGEMRIIVEEKLEKTLNERISQSFKLVNDNLDKVNTGLGEMKSLASDVGDLRKVMSGVKTRGILGEVQLGNLIKDILAVGQYEENVATKAGSTDRVEFAVRLPGSSDEGVCYLPIDAKYPADTYSHLLDAYDTTDKDLIDKAKRELATRIKEEAKAISDKYIDVPNTASFGILFLPFEGLYAEVINLGLMEELQSKYNVTIAGPTTLIAMLTSFQMGFKTLAIQKRSGEIEQLLGAVKTEFNKFGDVMASARKKIQQADDELDKLMTTRSRAIERKLRGITQLEDDAATDLLEE